MAQEHSPIDISDMPELLAIVEEVQATRRPRVLRRDSTDVAILIPVPVKTKHARSRATDPDAALSAAGSWKDLVDADALKAQLADERGSRSKIGQMPPAYSAAGTE